MQYAFKEVGRAVSARLDRDRLSELLRGNRDYLPMTLRCG